MFVRATYTYLEYDARRAELRREAREAAWREGKQGIGTGGGGVAELSQGAKFRFLFGSVPVLVPVRASPVPSVVRGR